MGTIPLPSPASASSSLLLPSSTSISAAVASETLSSLLYPRKVSITPDNQGPVVNIVNWLCIVTTILAVLTRLTLRLVTSKGIHKDDVAVLAGITFAIGHTAAVTSQVTNGLGRRQATLTPLEIDSYQQAAYASQILFIFGCIASKISTTVLLYTITPAKNWRIVTKYFGYSVLVWGIVSFFCIVFQCRSPQTWAVLNLQGRCFNQNAFWSFNIIVDIFQELFMVLIPILFVKGLHMTLSHKLVVVFAFSFRILVVIFSIVRLYYLLSPPAPSTGGDTIFASTNPVIFTHLTLCTSLTVSCVPFLKSVMENLQSGLFANHGQHGLFAGSGASPSGSYAMKNLSKSGKLSNGGGGGTQASQISQVKRVKPMLDDDELMIEMENQTERRLRIEVVDSVEVTTIVERQEDEESLNSLSGSERRILGRGHSTMVQGGNEVR